MNARPFHESTVRPGTRIAVEPGFVRDGCRINSAFFIRVYTMDVITHQEYRSSQTEALDRFERIVENHVNGIAVNQ